MLPEEKSFLNAVFKYFVQCLYVQMLIRSTFSGEFARLPFSGRENANRPSAHRAPCPSVCDSEEAA